MSKEPNVVIGAMILFPFRIWSYPAVCEGL